MPRQKSRLPGRRSSSPRRGAAETVTLAPRQHRPGELRRLAEADRQHAARQRIEAATVSCLASTGIAFHLLQGRVRAQAGRLVEQHDAVNGVELGTAGRLTPSLDPCSRRGLDRLLRVPARIVRHRGIDQGARAARRPQAARPDETASSGATRSLSESAPPGHAEIRPHARAQPALGGIALLIETVRRKSWRS